MERLAIDIGGTFTDLVHYDSDSGTVSFAKTLTRPEDPAQGVMDAIRIAVERGFLNPEAVSFFVHGGTTVINAITERKGVKTALITTRGFRDILEIGRGNRPDLYNLHSRSPQPFVPRHLRFEVTERVMADGRVLEPLKEDELAPIVETLRREKVAAVAVLLLHSYTNPDHEARCAALLRQALPDVAVTASHEISREWREYERSNTAVLNAYVQPIIETYFVRLGASLRAEKIGCPLFAMQSNGGVTSFEWAQRHPLALVESGPAGGVSAAVRIGEITGESEILSLDVGGTTAKCSLVRGSEPKLATQYKLEATRLYPGYPIQIPVVDIVEIGAGGGSIAWFDASGALRVGPVSAGADPGPACYGKGGTEPTVTDAKLLTGVLDPETFAQGSLALDVAKSEQAMSAVAKKLGSDLVGAANAVIRIAEANMINALKLVTIQRGHDPRELTLVASGGGGPMHVAQLGRELGVRRIIVPPLSGLLSAWGMLTAMPRHDIRRTDLLPASDGAIDAARRTFSDMRHQAIEHFRIETGADLGFKYAIDMRYAGQEHTVPVAIEDPETLVLEKLLKCFHAAHETAYTFALPGTPAEMVNFHLQAEEIVPRPQPMLLDIRPDGDPAPARSGRRLVDLAEDGVHDCAVYDRGRLMAGDHFAGPALVEEASSTTLLLPDQLAMVDRYGHIVIEARR